MAEESLESVQYAIYSDTISATQFPPPPPHQETLLLDLRIAILNELQPLLNSYVWQHEAFNLEVVKASKLGLWHLSGSTRFGDNIEDEWFIVFLLKTVSAKVADISVTIRDNDGEFLLIEAAYVIPRWLKPENSLNRVFLRGGCVHLVRRKIGEKNGNLSVEEAVGLMKDGEGVTKASEEVQEVIARRIKEYPEQARRNMHKARCVVPLPVAQVLKHEPQLVALAVEAFYRRDIDAMKAASRMERFLLGEGSNSEMVEILVTMSRAMYAQLHQQMFAPPRKYPMPAVADPKYKQAELGMKLTCGFEMMYWERQRCEGDDVDSRDEGGTPKGLEQALAGDPGWEAYCKMTVNYSDSEDGDERDDHFEIPVDDAELAATPEIAKKRKGRGLNTSFAKKQRVVETLDDYSSPTTLPFDWKEAVETITLGSSVPVIAICGAKNVGKSTFARFLVNSLLNRYKEVAYLDTDVGQPEFTAPGCLSLHVLDNPVVGPPAMHLRSPERCFFYGDVTPKSNPLMYGEHVAGLVNYFREKYSVHSTSTIPLVINTHGWVKGIGYDVVVDILNSTSPTHVVQVLSNSEKKNLPRNKFWDETSTAETIYVESAVEKLPMHHRSARSAHHLRAARFLAYFQQCFGENSAPFPYREAKLFAQTAMSLVRDTPYEVPFTALKIKHLHSEVPPSETLRCVNATIVGLGVTAVDKDTRDNHDLSRSSVPLCLGLGIVKAVDMRRGVFYISTPVPQEQLQHVDILLQGRVEIPVPLLMARGFMCPYLKKTSQIVEGVGAGAMKSTMKPSAKKVQ